MLNIKNEYIDKRGNKYNIKNINLEDKSDLNNIGKFLTESRTNEKVYNTLEDGVYVYISKQDPTKLLKIYKDFANYKYTHHDDANFISKLQNLQKNIKLTDFPTGIITLENSVIGRENIYYKNYETLNEKIQNVKNVKELLYYYKQVINILKELSFNNIIYSDLHGSNIMIKEKDVKLIDFESNYVDFNNTKSSYNKMIINLTNTINSINEKINLGFFIKDCVKLEDIENQINIKCKKI